MGSQFFKSTTAKINPTAGSNLTARAIGANNYTARSAASGAQKDLGAAAAFGKATTKKPDRSGIYPKGPKV